MLLQDSPSFIYHLSYKGLRWSLSQVTLGEVQGTPWTNHQFYINAKKNKPDVPELCCGIIFLCHFIRLKMLVS